MLPIYDNNKIIIIVDNICMYDNYSWIYESKSVINFVGPASVISTFGNPLCVVKGRNDKTTEK